jgi:hypothetical protein
MGAKRAWWVIKAGSPAPVLVTSYWQSGGHFAVVRNRSAVRGFSTVFEVRPHDPADADRFATSPAVAEAFLRSRRRLGAGLSKIEVRDARVAVARGWRAGYGHIQDQKVGGVRLT